MPIVPMPELNPQPPVVVAPTQAHIAQWRPSGDVTFQFRMVHGDRVDDTSNPSDALTQTDNQPGAMIISKSELRRRELKRKGKKVLKTCSSDTRSSKDSSRCMM
ncbi:hypothetical protein QQ045_028917 [Rhodiola kirilowii]